MFFFLYLFLVVFFFFFFNDTATTEIYTLSLHDALPIFSRLLLALCRCRLGLCSTHCLHPSACPMTTYQFFTTAWTWNSILLLLSALAFVGYLLAFRRRGRPVYFAAALVLFLLAFISPFSALA